MASHKFTTFGIEDNELVLDDTNICEHTASVLTSVIDELAEIIDTRNMLKQQTLEEGHDIDETNTDIADDVSVEDGTAMTAGLFAPYLTMIGFTPIGTAAGSTIGKAFASKAVALAGGGQMSGYVARMVGGAYGGYLGTMMSVYGIVKLAQATHQATLRLITDVKTTTPHVAGSIKELSVKCDRLVNAQVKPPGKMTYAGLSLLTFNGTTATAPDVLDTAKYMDNLLKNYPRTTVGAAALPHLKNAMDNFVSGKYDNVATEGKKLVDITADYLKSVKHAVALTQTKAVIEGPQFVGSRCFKLNTRTLVPYLKSKSAVGILNSTNTSLYTYVPSDSQVHETLAHVKSIVHSLPTLHATVDAALQIDDSLHGKLNAILKHYESLASSEKKLAKSSGLVNIIDLAVELDLYGCMNRLVILREVTRTTGRILQYVNAATI